MASSKRNGLIAIGLMAAALAIGVPVNQNPTGWGSADLWATAYAEIGIVGIDGIEVDIGVGKFKIKHLDAKGSTLSADELKSLIEGKDPATIADRLSRLSAASITIPEVVYESTAAGLAQTVIYRNVVLDTVVDGRATTVSIGGSESSSTMPTGEKMSGTQQAITMDGFDLAAMARVITGKAASDNEPLVPIYDSFTGGRTEFDFGGLMKMHIGSTSGGRFRGRPLKTPMIEAFGKLAAMGAVEPGGTPTPDQMASLGSSMTALLDMYRAFAFESMEAKDVGMTMSPGTGQDVAMTFTGFSIKDFADMRFGEFNMDGLAVSYPQGKFGLGKFSLKGFDIGPMMSSLIDAMVNLPAPATGLESTQPSAPDPMAKIATPHFDQILIEGLDIDAQLPIDSNMPDSPLGQFKMALAKFDLTTKNWLNNIPTQSVMTTDHFVFTPPANDPKFDAMRKAGLTSLDISSRVEAGYDQTSKRLSLSDMVFSGQGLGKLSLKAVLENVGPELFSGDEMMAQMAMVMATAKSFDLDIVNEGALGLLLTTSAEQSGMPVDQFREQLVASATLMLPQMMGNSAQVQELVAAISAFLKEPKRIQITATSQAGVGMMDMADMPTLMGKVQMKSAANH